MRTVLVSTSLLFLSLTVPAQKSIAGLVNAEKAFAVFTASHTIREGFLRYMDTSGVIFQHATPVNALETYRKQKAGTGILNWSPEFAVISASGDMGITTGPYEYKTSSSDSVPSHGSFSSVWQINKEGLWKNMVDLGTSYQAAVKEVKDVHQVVLTTSEPEGSTYEELLAMDQALNSIIHKKNTVALASFFPEDSRLNRDNYAPVIGTQAVVSGLGDFGRQAILIPIKGAIAESKDLAWFYGSVISGTRKENYLRVWVLRNGKWSVIFQTIKG